MKDKWARYVHMYISARSFGKKLVVFMANKNLIAIEVNYSHSKENGEHRFRFEKLIWRTRAAVARYFMGAGQAPVVGFNKIDLPFFIKNCTPRQIVLLRGLNGIVRPSIGYLMDANWNNLLQQFAPLATASTTTSRVICRSINLQQVCL